MVKNDSIENRIARIERVLQDIADGVKPWEAARKEFGSECIAPDAVVTWTADGMHVVLVPGTKVGPEKPLLSDEQRVTPVEARDRP